MFTAYSAGDWQPQSQEPSPPHGNKCPAARPRQGPSARAKVDLVSDIGEQIGRVDSLGITSFAILERQPMHNKIARYNLYWDAVVAPTMVASAH